MSSYYPIWYHVILSNYYLLQMENKEDIVEKDNELDFVLFYGKNKNNHEVK